MNELTAEEKKLIVQILSSTPIQGNIQQLPRIMQQIIEIIKKLS